MSSENKPPLAHWRVREDGDPIRSYRGNIIVLSKRGKRLWSGHIETLAGGKRMLQTHATFATASKRARISIDRMAECFPLTAIGEAHE